MNVNTNNGKKNILCSLFFRLIIFKIVAQFVILGCTWILGLYQSNLFFQVLFIILNSQQGTFLYIVHCLLNKEVDLSLSYALITFCSFTTSHLNVHTRPIVTQWREHKVSLWLFAKKNDLLVSPLLCFTNFKKYNVHSVTMIMVVKLYMDSSVWSYYTVLKLSLPGARGIH